MIKFIFRFHCEFLFIYFFCEMDISYCFVLNLNDVIVRDIVCQTGIKIIIIFLSTYFGFNFCVYSVGRV